MCRIKFPKHLRISQIAFVALIIVILLTVGYQVTLHFFTINVDSIYYYKWLIFA